MIKITNPYRVNSEYNCFGCGPNNEHGLQMEFFEDGENIISIWEPVTHFCGYKDVIHGGIQGTLMDEVASWVIYVKLETSGVTSSMNINYRRPLLASKGKIKIYGKIEKQDGRITSVATKIYDGKGTLCSEGIVNYYVFDKKKAVEKLGYPGIEKFYGK